jgi:hypothetical protein
MTRWHVEQRLYFNLAQVVEQAEREEGMTYPEDQLPCKTFEYKGIGFNSTVSSPIAENKSLFNFKKGGYDSKGAIFI